MLPLLRYLLLLRLPYLNPRRIKCKQVLDTEIEAILWEKSKLLKELEAYLEYMHSVQKVCHHAAAVNAFQLSSSTNAVAKVVPCLPVFS